MFFHHHKLYRQSAETFLEQQLDITSFKWLAKYKKMLCAVKYNILLNSKNYIQQWCLGIKVTSRALLGIPQ